MGVLRPMEIQFQSVTQERKEKLYALAGLIKNSITETGAAHVNFICTHNSRRSQLAEYLLLYLSWESGIQKIFTYSGGTEATAFNHRMVAALRHLDYPIMTVGGEGNPLYLLARDGEDHYFFSKKYYDDYNPASDFIAVTVCSDAEENCPLIHNCRARFHLKYIDPKLFDDTSQEEEAYQNKVKEVAGEMQYLVGLIL